MYNNKLISHIYKYYKFDLKGILYFTTITNSNSCNTSKPSNCNIYNINTNVNLRNNGFITKELGRLEKTENIVKDIDSLHRLVTSNVFIYDDRVQKALKDLSLSKHQISDYETLLKAVEIFYRTNEYGIMMAILSYFSKDIPYLPNDILLEMTKYYTKRFKDNILVESLQLQLYSNTINTIGNISKQEQEKKQERKGEKHEQQLEQKEQQVDISNNDIESILYYPNIIKDQRVVYNTLNSIDLSRELDCKELLNILKLYNILISNGSYRIEGFMTKIVDRFNNLLLNNNNSSNTNSKDTDNNNNDINNSGDNNNDIYKIEYQNIPDQKDIINCYRMLIKIRNYETFDIITTSNIINDRCYYSCKDLMLVLKELYYSSFKLDNNIYMPIIKGIFDNITQLNKDAIVLLVRFLNKNNNNNNNDDIIKLNKDQDELANFQVMLHTSLYNSNDILNLLNYYLNRNDKEDLSIVIKLYEHLNSFDGISDIYNFSKNIGHIELRDNNTIGNTISNYNTNSNDSSSNNCYDINTNLYILNKFILYFKDKDSLNSLMIRRYVRSLNRNYLSLNNKVISYSLYVLYKIGYNPNKLINNLLPILHTNIERYNSVDLTQILLFFNMFRLRYEHFYQIIVDMVQNKLLNHEFNDKQLVIISRCLYNYKKTFTSNLFNTIFSRLEYMNISQISTVFNSYVKSGLNDGLIINKTNELILNNLDKMKYNDVIKLLLPIKKGYIRERLIIEHIKNYYELEAGDYFDVFGVIPKDEDLDEQQVIKCTISLGKKERNKDIDRFARNLFIKIIKISPKLSERDSSLILNNILSYGYIKPKINRILTNIIQKYNIKKKNIEKKKNKDKNLEVFKYFRHISKGPPHLDKIKMLK